MILTKPLSRQRDLRPVARLALEAAWSDEREVGELCASVVAQEERAVLKGPFAGGEQITWAATLGRDGAFRSFRRAAEGHAALAWAGGEHPAAGHRLRRRAGAYHGGAGDGLFAGATREP